MTYEAHYFFGWHVMESETRRLSTRTVSERKAWRLADYLNHRPLTSKEPTVPAWITVTAESRDDALDAAREYPASAYDTDIGSAEIDFDVTPAVEELP